MGDIQAVADLTNACSTKQGQSDIRFLDHNHQGEEQ
jgi:hypothetical protein